MVISGPSIEHAVFMMGAFAARALYAPVSTGYSLLSQDFSKLRHTFNICRPKVILADDGPLYEAALKALPLDGVEVVTVTPPQDIPATAFADLIATPSTDSVDSSINAISPKTHARTMFTSGSTGLSKAVIHTHGMLMAYLGQQEGMFLPDEGYCSGEILSWLPWSHIGGANNLSFALNSGATLYIDEGRPIPGQHKECIRNLREIAVERLSVGTSLVQLSR